MQADNPLQEEIQILTWLPMLPIFETHPGTSQLLNPHDSEQWCQEA